MAKSDEKRLYRVVFLNQGKVYEIFARIVAQGGLFGFVEIEDLVFGEKSTILVDPSEDALKKEFENTRRIFIPMHSVIRIDEMEKDSALKPRIVPLPGKGESAANGEGRVTPIYTPPPGGHSG